MLRSLVGSEMCIRDSSSDSALSRHADTGFYTLCEGKINSTFRGDFKWLPETVESLHRNFLYDSDDEVAVQQFLYPRVDVLDGTEPTIDELLSGLDATKGLGENASYEWFEGSCGGTVVGTGATLPVTPTVTTTYYVRATGECGTTECEEVTVVVSELVLALEDQELCADGSIELSANATGLGALSYEWSPAETLDDPASATPTATPTETTTYTVTVTDELGCQAIDELTITQLDSTEVFCEAYQIRDEDGNLGEWIDLAGSCVIEVCEMNGGQDLIFDAGPDIDSGWVWTDEDGNVIPSVTGQPTFSDIGFDDAGIYTGTLTNENGCVSVLNFEVIVNKSVEATVLATIMDYCDDGSGEALITVSEGMGPYTINWQSQDGTETGTTTLNEPGDYTLSGLNGGTTYCIEVIDAKGCEIAP